MNIQKMPIISCIITTYNRSNIVSDAIDSILSQTYDNWELIIVDDQSSDNTWSVIKEYEKYDTRIHCFFNHKKGANYARNLGIDNARGKYVAFLDDDDISLPHRFQSQLAAMHKTGFRFIVSWFDVKNRLNGQKIKTDKQIIKGAGVGFPSRWMIEKSLLEDVGGFNPKMIAMQDIELSYRIACKYTFAHHANVVTTMYNTPNSTSTGRKSINGKIQLIEEVGHLMHPLELSMWNSRIAIGFYQINDLENSIEYFKRAAESDKRAFFKMFHWYFLSLKAAKPDLIKKIVSKVLRQFNKYEYFKIVKHPIVK